MIYVVEIRGPGGGRATKEYEAVSLRAAIRLVDLELRNYPNYGRAQTGKCQKLATTGEAYER